MGLWQEILIVLGCVVAGFMIGLLLMFLFRRKKLKLYSLIKKDPNFVKTEGFKEVVATLSNNKIYKSNGREDPLEVLVKNHKNIINAEISKQPIVTDVIGDVDIIHRKDAPAMEKEEKPHGPVIQPATLVTPGNQQMVEEPKKTSELGVLRGLEITNQKAAPLAENQKAFLEPNKPEPEIHQPTNTTPIERQKESPNSDLVTELETNLVIATTPWADKLIPFQTKYWYAKQGESELLLTSHYKELIPLYVDIGLANNIVWLATEIGHSSKELDESYIKLCSGIADGLKRIMSSLNETV